MNKTGSIKTGSGKKEIKITQSNFFLAALIYLTVPVIIFFFGYLKPVWAVLFSLLTAFACWWTWHDMAAKKAEKPLTERSVTVKTSYFVFLIPAVLLVIYLSGVGEFSWCVGDHRVRYAILYDLINYKWPVIYDFSTQSNPAVAQSLGQGKVAFAYYFVFWMVPALVGKVFGLMAARIAIFIWSAIGLVLVAIGAMLLYGKQSRFIFVALMLFAGFDIFPYYYRLWTGFNPTWEDWTWHLRVMGNFYQIMNVFHQSIPGWLVTVLLLLCVKSNCVGLLGSLMFCYSPWAAIGILPMCVVKLFEANRGLKAKEVVKNIFSFGNVLAPVVFFICFAPFYTANSNATAADNGFIWNFYSKWSDLLFDYLCYVVFEFGIWSVIIRKKYRKDWMFYGAIATMLIIPIYKMTVPNDLLMRGSMAPLFAISLYAVMFVTDAFNEMMAKGNKALKPRITVLTLLLSAYTTFNFLLTTVLFTAMIYAKIEPAQDITTGIVSFGNVADEQYLDMVRDQFYVYDYKNKIFFKYLAK